MNKMKKFIFELLTFCVVLFAVYAYSRPLNDMRYTDYTDDLCHLAINNMSSNNINPNNITYNFDQNGKFMPNSNAVNNAFTCPNINYAGFGSSLSANAAKHANDAQNSEKHGANHDNDQNWISYITNKVWKRQSEQKSKRRRVEELNADYDIKMNDTNRNELVLRKDELDTDGAYCASNPRQGNSADYDDYKTYYEQDSYDKFPIDSATNTFDFENPKQEVQKHANMQYENEEDDAEGVAGYNQNTNVDTNNIDQIRNNYKTDKYFKDTLDLKKVLKRRMKTYVGAQKKPHIKLHHAFFENIPHEQTAKDNKMKTLKHGVIVAGNENAAKTEHMQPNVNNSRYMQDHLNDKPKQWENSNQIGQYVTDKYDNLDIAIVWDLIDKVTAEDATTNKTSTESTNSSDEQESNAIENTASEDALSKSDTFKEGSNKPTISGSGNANRKCENGDVEAKVETTTMPPAEPKGHECLIDNQMQDFSKYLTNMKTLQKITKKEARLFENFIKSKPLEKAARYIKCQTITEQPLKDMQDDMDDGNEDDNDDIDDDDESSEEQKIETDNSLKTANVSRRADRGVNNVPIVNITADTSKLANKHAELDAVQKNVEDVRQMLNDVDAEQKEAASPLQQIRQSAENTVLYKNAIATNEELAAPQQNTYQEEQTSAGLKDSNLSTSFTGNEAVEIDTEVEKAVNNILGEFQSDYGTTEIHNVTAIADGAEGQTAAEYSQVQQQVKPNNENKNTKEADPVVEGKAEEQNDDVEYDEQQKIATKDEPLLDDSKVTSAADEKENLKSRQKEKQSDDYVDIRVIPDEQEKRYSKKDNYYDFYKALAKAQNRENFPKAKTRRHDKAHVESASKDDEEADDKTKEEPRAKSKNAKASVKNKTAEQQPKSKEDKIKSDQPSTKSEEEEKPLKPEKEAAVKEFLEPKFGSVRNYEKTLQKMAHFIKQLQETHFKDLTKPDQLSKEDDVEDPKKPDKSDDKENEYNTDEEVKKKVTKVDAKEDESSDEVKANVEDDKKKDNHNKAHDGRNIEKTDDKEKGSTVYEGLKKKIAKVDAKEDESSNETKAYSIEDDKGKDNYDKVHNGRKIDKTDDKENGRNIDEDIKKKIVQIITKEDESSNEMKAYSTEDDNGKDNYAKVHNGRKMDKMKTDDKENRSSIVDVAKKKIAKMFAKEDESSDEVKAYSIEDDKRKDNNPTVHSERKMDKTDDKEKESRLGEVVKKKIANVNAKDDEKSNVVKAYSIKDNKKKDNYEKVHEDENKKSKKPTDDNNINANIKNDGQVKKVQEVVTEKDKIGKIQDVPLQDVKPKEEAKTHIANKVNSEQAKNKDEILKEKVSAAKVQQQQASLIDKYMQELEIRDKYLQNEVEKAVSNVIYEFQNEIDSTIKRNEHRTPPKSASQNNTIKHKSNKSNKSNKMYDIVKQDEIKETTKKEKKVKFANWREKDHVDFMKQIDKNLTEAKKTLSNFLDNKEKFYEKNKEEIEKLSLLERLQERLQMQDVAALNKEVHKAVNNVIYDINKNNSYAKQLITPKPKESFYTKIWNFLSYNNKKEPNLIQFDRRLQDQVNDAVKNVVVEVQQNIDETVQGYDNAKYNSSMKKDEVETTVNTALKSLGKLKHRQTKKHKSSRFRNKKDNKKSANVAKASEEKRDKRKGKQFAV